MRPKLLLLLSDDRFFWSHRLPIARAALRRGYEVVVATAVYGSAQQFEAEGFRLIRSNCCARWIHPSTIFALFAR